MNGAATFAITQAGTYTILLEGTAEPHQRLYADRAYRPAADGGRRLQPRSSARWPIPDQHRALYLSPWPMTAGSCSTASTPTPYANWTLTGPDGYSLTRTLLLFGELRARRHQPGSRTGLRHLHDHHHRHLLRRAAITGSSSSISPPPRRSHQGATTAQRHRQSRQRHADLQLQRHQGRAAQPRNARLLANTLSVRLIDPFGNQVFGPQADRCPADHAH